MSSTEGIGALDGLKDFQRKTVEHVERAFFEEGRRRFLVADEVGLGKTLVARGLVGRTIERLKAHTPPVKRIDIVYICSNQEIARQNLRRLNVLERDDLALPSRITLLPLHTKQLAKHDVNFVSFTPGTSFDPRSRTGWSRERALLYRMLRGPWSLGKNRGTREVIRVGAAWSSIEYELRGMQEVDRDIERRFVRAASKQTLREDLERFGALDVRLARDLDPSMRLRDEFARLATIARRRKFTGDERRDRDILIAALRRQLARVCVDALEPDLVILDEFQRFPSLLEGDSEAAQLAHQLFAFERGEEMARVLLLSATPYRTFTQAGEEGVAHHEELSRLLRFLFEDSDRAAQVEGLLLSFRNEMFRAAGDGIERLADLRDRLQQALGSVMVRTERLASSATRNGMLETKTCQEFDLASGDVESWVEIADLHALLRDRAYLRSGAALTELWKTAPWLPQFMDLYKFKDAIDDALAESADDPQLAAALRRVKRRLSWDRFRSYKELVPPNPRSRSLLADSSARAWRLLWIPPSMPYHQPGRPFDSVDGGLTKRLVFSSWTVAPRAIAALTSYDAERRAFKSIDSSAKNTAKSRRAHERRLLDFKMARAEDSDDRHASMPHLAWVYPSVTLAAATDPLDAWRELGDAPARPVVLDWARARVRDRLATLAVEYDESRPGVDQRWYWAAPLLMDAAEANPSVRAFWENYWLEWEWSQEGVEHSDQRRGENWERHVELATEVFQDGLALGQPPDDLADVLARLGLAGAGNVALRALHRVVPGADEEATILGAAKVAWGVRRLFNSPEAIAIVDALSPGTPYWRAALDYGIAGNLQAVFDEWVHVLADDAGVGRLSEDRVLELLCKRTQMALKAVTSRVEVDRLDGGKPEGWRTHFGVRYGQGREGGPTDSIFPEEIRRSFNSPFRPFVLATTSVGQEGLDFHTYCHAVMHWNLPSNPVDLEQREGRVHRYKGHAVRRNVAERHAAAARRSSDADPWAAAFGAAATARRRGEDELVPYWLQPGSAFIERYVPALPLSRDAERYERVRQQVTLYRMVFGQPRQDDLVAYLQEAVGQARAEKLAELLKVDLSPREPAN